MYKAHVVDCQHLMSLLKDDVPNHVSSNTLTPNLINRICKRLLTEAIFRALPNECTFNNLNLMDYSLLDNVLPDELERLLDITMDNLKSLFFNQQYDLQNYAHIKCHFDGKFLHILAGIEKCETKYSPLMSTDCSKI